MLMKELFIPLATGLALFLFGMQVIRMGFEAIFLEKVQRILNHITQTPSLGLLTGTLATAILQSSSAVMLLTIGLTHAKIMTFRQSIGIILGANIGTVLTAELVAFRLEDFGLYFLLLGGFLFLMRTFTLRCWGIIVGGFGLLFIGMDTIQSITPVLTTLGWVDALYVLGSDGIISGVIAGTMLTSLIQSSTATTALTMGLMADQLFTMSTAIAIILGSNIGTCVTALLASIGANLAARRVAIAHVLLNIGGVLLFLPLIPVLVTTVEWMTANHVHQVAHAGLIFNVVCSLLVLPVIISFEKLVITWTPK